MPTWPPAHHSTRNVSSASGIVVHRRKVPVPSEDRARIGPVPVTSPTRMLIDMAAAVPEGRLQAAFDSALNKRLTSVEEIDVRLESLHLRGRPGSRVLKELLREAAGHPSPDSPLERRSSGWRRKRASPISCVSSKSTLVGTPRYTSISPSRKQKSVSKRTDTARTPPGRNGSSTDDETPR